MNSCIGGSRACATRIMYRMVPTSDNARVGYLCDKGGASVDRLCVRSGLPLSVTSAYGGQFTPRLAKLKKLESSPAPYGVDQPPAGMAPRPLAVRVRLVVDRAR